MSELTRNRLLTRKISITGMMVALTLILSFTPLGMIHLPVVNITIAHVPAIITALIIGLSEGFVVALAFGLSSLFLALSSPTSILGPFFINPLISILPRVLIPVTTYFTYKAMNKLLKSTKQGENISIIIATAVGNLTNTFGVYTMLYLVYAQQIFEKSGKPALDLIIGAISVTTMPKCLGIVIIVLPIVKALKRFKRTQ